MWTPGTIYRRNCNCMARIQAIELRLELRVEIGGTISLETFLDRCSIQTYMLPVSCCTDLMQCTQPINFIYYNQTINYYAEIMSVVS